MVEEHAIGRERGELDDRVEDRLPRKRSASGPEREVSVALAIGQRRGTSGEEGAKDSSDCFSQVWPRCARQTVRGPVANCGL